MRRFKDVNYYAVLGVSSTATRDEIKSMMDNTGQTCSAPSRPSPASRSDIAVKPDRSTDASVPSTHCQRVECGHRRASRGK